MTYRNTAASGSFEVDIVDADGEIADTSEMRQRCNSRGIEAIGDHAEYGIGPAEPSKQFLMSGRKIIIPQLHPSCLGQSAQRRLRNCLIGMRAEPYAYGSDEYVDLELYLMWRARGMTVETPAVRP